MRTIKLTETELKNTIKGILNEVLGIRKPGIKEIKYFHPSGKQLPNGSNVQRGGFLHECKVNRESYELDEAVHGEQYGLAKYRGGVITFSTDVNAVKLSDNQLVNKVKQVVETLKQRLGRNKIIHKQVNLFNDENSEEYIGAYSVGNFFKGKYVGDNGEMFNEKSVSVEINGLSSRSLFKMAEMLAKAFRQETVLVKDLNNGKIYLADSAPSTEPFEKEMERINTEV